MTDNYLYLTVDGLNNYLYHDIVVCNQPILFTFDTRKKVSRYERALQKWYMLSISACEEVFIALIVSDKGEELESQVITRRIELDEFVENYCKRHNPKFKGRVCVDDGYWWDCDWHSITGEWR